MTTKEKLEHLGWKITKEQYHLEFNNNHLNVKYWWLNKTIETNCYDLQEEYLKTTELQLILDYIKEQDK